MNSQKPTYTLNRRPALAAALPTMALAACAMVNSVSAQSSDAIINKLVAKGVLTEQEAKELKQEANQDFTKAYQVKSGLPEWVTSLKLGGDFRGRYEGFFGDDPAFKERTRLRYRVRAGLTATLKDNFEVGFRLTSDEAAKDSSSFGGDPIGANATFQDNGSKKFVYIDLAYGKWKMLNTEEFKSTWTVGKMENPFVLSEMVFDPDYTPEGLAQQFTYNLNEAHALKLNLGGFMLDESSKGADPWLVGAQALWDAKWSSHWQSSLGVAALYIDQSDVLTTNNVPNINSGNRRLPGGDILASDFYPVIGSGFLTYSLDSFPCYAGAFPIRVGGEYMHNPGASLANSGYWTGVQFGKSGKKGTWELSYRWKYLEGDAWWEELVDSDFGAFYGSGSARTDNRATTDYRAGTNVKGHVVRASYSPYNALTLGVSCSLTELIDNPATTDSGMTRLQVDAILKF